MPSPKKQGHTALLVQVHNDTHGKADARRRREGVTWSAVINMLLRRWADGADDDVLKAPVRRSTPTNLNAEEAERLAAEWMNDPAYARAATERVDIATLPRYRSLGELLAAEAARAGRTIPASVVAELEDDDDV